MQKQSSNKSKPKKRSRGQRPVQQGKQSKAFKTQNAAVALGNKTFQSKPSYRSVGENLIVSHREYVKDVNGSTGFVTTSVSMNPGIQPSFPWLNQIASRFESYRFRKLHYRFMTEAPTSTSGFVALCPDYDPEDPAPLTKQTAFQYDNTVKCAPWENTTMVASRENLNKRKSYFVRQGQVPNLDVYDTGNLFVCTGGQTGIAIIGELWCDYEVEFMTPQLDTRVASSSAKMSAVNIAGQTPVLPFGSFPDILFSRDTLFTYSNASGALTFLRDFDGLFVFSVTGTGITNLTETGSSNNLYMIVAVDAAATGAIASAVITCGAGTTVDFAVTGTTCISALLRVSEYPVSLV